MLKGVFSPTVTVMTETGFDAAATLRHMQWLVGSGVHGLCPGAAAVSLSG